MSTKSFASAADLEEKKVSFEHVSAKGETVVWLPQERTLLSGDLVEFDATPYAGDAYFQDWPRTLQNIGALKPLALVPGRGHAVPRPPNLDRQARLPDVGSPGRLIPDRHQSAARH